MEPNTGTKPRIRGFKVCSRRCDECLFSSQRIVPPARVKAILNGCLRDNKHFICHKHSERWRDRLDDVADEEDMEDDTALSVPEEFDVCCRGFFDTYPYATIGMRLAHSFHLIIFVDEEGNVVEAPTSLREAATEDGAEEPS